MPPLPRTNKVVVTPAPPPCTLENLKGVLLGMCTLDYPLRDTEAKVAEIVPGIFMGEGPLNPDRLKKRGVVRVLNCSAEKEVSVTNNLENPYKDFGIKYMALAISDSPSTDIRPDLEPVAKFLDRGLVHGSVYVHSIHGTSRAAIFVVAYLMRRRGMGGVEALRAVQMRRPVAPHDGFLRLIVELDREARRLDAWMKRHLEMTIDSELVKPRPIHAPIVHYRDPEVYRFAASCLHRQKVAQKLYFNSDEPSSPITHDSNGKVKRIVFVGKLVA